MLIIGGGVTRRRGRRGRKEETVTITWSYKPPLTTEKHQNPSTLTEANEKKEKVPGTYTFKSMLI